MNDFGLPQASYELITDLLRQYQEVDEAVVFGSRALGNFRPGSDVDLALKGADITPLLALDISAQLNERMPLPWFFDVLDYNSIGNPALKAHIDTYGKQLFCNRIAAR